MKLHTLLKTFALLSLIFSMSSLVACGGGGGGGGGGNGSSGGGSGGRSTRTSLRIMHGAIDSVPVCVKIADVTIQCARFAEVTDYVRVEPGDVILTIERANSPGVIVGTLAVSFAPRTEYTLFSHGEVRTGSFGFSVFADGVERPEKGFGRIRLVNSLVGASSATISAEDVASDPVGFAGVGEFVTAIEGVKNFVVRDGSGAVVATLAAALPDRGELTVMVTGKESLGVVFAPVYPDFD